MELNVFKIMAENITEAVNEMMSTAPFTRCYTATVISQIDQKGGYRIKISGQEYKATSYFELTSGQLVYAVAPNNNFNSLFLIPFKGKELNSGSETITPTSASDIKVIDTNGLVGSAGNIINTQLLLDTIAEKIANKMLSSDDLVSEIVDDAKKIASMKALYNLNEKVDQNLTISQIDLSTLNSNIKGNATKFGKLVCFAGKLNVNGGVTFTLPEDFYPTKNVQGGQVYYEGSACGTDSFTITVNGNVSLRSWAVFSATYMCK